MIVVFLFLYVCFITAIFLLIYIYFGYPLIIFGLAKLFPRPPKKETIFPEVTIVIPAHNEEAIIGEKLENVFNLDYPQEALQILVCDDASEDRTSEIVQTFFQRDVELVKGITRTGKAGALNRAMQFATGEFFVISDADTLIDRSALKELIANFADQSVGCVVAQTHMMKTNGETSDSGGLYWRYEALIRQNESNIHSSVAATGHMMGLRRNILHPIPTNVVLDDFYLALMTMQQGFRVIFEPKAVVWERPTNSMKDEIVRRSRMTAGRFQVISIVTGFFSQLPILLRFEIISHKFLRLAISPLMIIALLLNISLAVFTNISENNFSLVWNLTVFGSMAIQCIFYALAIVGKFFFTTINEKTKTIKLLMVPYYLCATNFASISGLIMHLTGKRTVLWQQARRQ